MEKFINWAGNSNWFKIEFLFFTIAYVRPDIVALDKQSFRVQAGIGV